MITFDEFHKMTKAQRDRLFAKSTEDEQRQLLSMLGLEFIVEEQQQNPMSARELAKLLGCSASTVSRQMHKSDDDSGYITWRMVRGADGKMRPNRRFDTRERDEAIRQMHRDGKSQRDIAAALECSKGTVHRIISKEK